MKRMDMVIVTIKSQEEKQLMDIEIPFDITAEELAASLANYMQLKEIKGLWAEPLHRELLKKETLKEAGVWEGSYLILIN